MPFDPRQTAHPIAFRQQCQGFSDLVLCCMCTIKDRSTGCHKVHTADVTKEAVHSFTSFVGFDNIGLALGLMRFPVHRTSRVGTKCSGFSQLLHTLSLQLAEVYLVFAPTLKRESTLYCLSP